MNNKAFLIFSGWNLRGVLAFCRQLSILDRDFWIVARNDNDGILYTRYKRNVCAIRKSDKLNNKDILRCLDEAKIKSKVDSFVICPSSEYLNKFFIDNREVYLSKGCELPLVDEKIYNLLTNKSSFIQLCSDNGFDVPKRRYGDFKEYPYVAKPVKNINASSKSLYPYLIFSKKDEDSFKNQENLEDYYFEEYVDGESYYLLLYLSKSGMDVRLSQKNILQQGNGKSILAAEISTLHESEFADKLINLLKRVGFFGIAMIEVKQHDGKLFIIEMNPRIWGPSQLILTSKAGILVHFICDCLDLNPPPDQQINKAAKYFWFNGLLDNVLNGVRLKWHLKQRGNGFFYLLNLFLSDVYLMGDSIRLFLYEFILVVFKRKRK